MKLFSPVSLSCLVLGVAFSLAPLPGYSQKVKKKGLFSFGKKEEGISSGLFPEKTASTEEEWVPGKEGEKLFKDNPGKTGSSKPQDEPGPVSSNAPANKKKSLFSFGKKSKVNQTGSAPVISPVPEGTPSTTPSRPQQSSPNPSAPRQREVAAPVTSSPPRKKSGNAVSRLFSIFPGKKKSTEEENALKEIANQSQYQRLGEPEGSDPQPSRKPGDDGQGSTAAQAPVSEGRASATASAQAAADTPNPMEQQSLLETSETSKKEKRKPGLFHLTIPSLPKIGKSSKTPDYRSVETVMKDGAFVEGQENSFSSVPATSSPGSHPPVVVDGVKTYSSWNDVEGSQTSAAEKIIRQLH